MIFTLNCAKLVLPETEPPRLNAHGRTLYVSALSQFHFLPGTSKERPDAVSRVFVNGKEYHVLEPCEEIARRWKEAFAAALYPLIQRSDVV